MRCGHESEKVQRIIMNERVIMHKKTNERKKNEEPI